MTYIAIHLKLNDGDDFSHKKSIEIYNLFYEKLKDFDIKFFNFNNYDRTENGKLICREVTIRYEYDDPKPDEIAHEIAENLKKKGEFQDYRTNRQLVTDHVKFAHEFASKCFIEMIKHNIYFQEMKKRPIKYLSYYFKYILTELGYNFIIETQYIDAYLNDDKLKNEVEEIFKNCLKFAPTNEDVYTDPEFLERFIHLFHNCALLQRNGYEHIVWGIINSSNCCIDCIVDTYKKR